MSKLFDAHQNGILFHFSIIPQYKRKCFLKQIFSKWCKQGLADFFVKRQIVNIFYFVGHRGFQPHFIFCVVFFKQLFKNVKNMLACPPYSNRQWASLVMYDLVQMFLLYKIMVFKCVVLKFYCHYALLKHYFVYGGSQNY